MSKLAFKCDRCDTPVRHRHCLCIACAMDDYDEPEIDDDEAFLSFECGMMADGYCSMAGSEECDWECPRNRP